MFCYVVFWNLFWSKWLTRSSSTFSAPPRSSVGIRNKTLIISKKLNCQNKFSLKKELEYASKFYHMDNLKKDQFNIFLQNPWYIEKMLNSCKQFTIRQLLELQISLSDAIKDLSNYHDDQQSILNKIATEFLC